MQEVAYVRDVKSFRIMALLPSVADKKVNEGKAFRIDPETVIRLKACAVIHGD